MSALAPKLAEIDEEHGACELVPRLLDADQIAELMNVTKRTVYNLHHVDPDFPEPITVGARFVRWRASDYNAYIARRLSEVAGAAGKRRR